MLRSTERSRGTGPCATGPKRGLKRSRGTGPRATVSKTAPFTVGRGPVPRHATIAGETRSHARVASEGPRPTVIERSRGTGLRATGPKNPPFYRRARACPSPCNDRGGNPLACTCGIRGATPYGDREIAGDRPPRYVYFVFFTSPNVVSIRFDADTGPRNIRIAKVSGLPSNATSSI